MLLQVEERTNEEKNDGMKMEDTKREGMGRQEKKTRGTDQLANKENKKEFNAPRKARGSSDRG